MKFNKHIKFNNILYIFIFLLPSMGQSYAAQKFIIEDIRVEGLKRITPGTVFNYLPVKVGDTFDDSHSSDVVRTLFKTGFFDDVRLERDGNVLVLIFKERPAIGSISMSGNEDIDIDDLLDNLKQFGFAEGRIFVQAQLDQVEQELRRQYFSFGKYAVKIKTEVTQLDNNRVGIHIDVSEGIAARIKKMNIVGNQSFEEEKLLDQFKLSTPTLFSFFTKTDQYSKQKFAGDLESLRSYYLDRGYLNFNIESTQVSITPDKKDIYITINITEGEQYTISQIKLAGDLVLPEQNLFELISINNDELFSRKAVTESSQALTNRLGEEGYSFANVNSIPEINKEDKTVEITFFIDPGKRVYVRRINFSGNSKTRDEVLRREMRQQESAWISTAQVERGKQRLNRTGYFKDINVETPVVQNNPDQVDIVYSVEEAPGGTLGIGLGYSPGQEFIFNTTVVQNNFLGSGKRVSFEFNNSKVNTRYSLGYLNPYFTIDGISQGYEIFYRETNATNANLTAYETTDGGGSISLGFPVTENNSIFAAFEYNRTKINLLRNSSSQIVNFVNENGDTFNTFTARASFLYDTTNKRILPDKGMLHRMSAEIAIPGIGDSLEFYKIQYRTQWFKDIYKDFVLSLTGEFNYGDGYGDTKTLPFFENFFAGGTNSVRGFKENTLGPVDSINRPLGGNAKIVTNAELFLPIPFLSGYKKSVRMMTFVDAGNVYGSDEDISLGDMKYSAGIGMIWVSPVGVINMSFAVPLNDESTDRTENFQFTFGTSF